MRPPSYIFGWLAIALLIFLGSFVAGRVAGRPNAEPSTPTLVRKASTVDDVRFVTAAQVLDASAAGDPTRPVIIDVRTSGEFAASHISGAVNIQDFQLPEAVTSLPHEQAWVLYCTCPDDRLAKWGAAAIEHAGFSNALVLQQGLQAWQQAGGPVTTSGDGNAVRQGCGCSVEADAFKLWAIDRAQRQAPQAP